MYVTWSDLIQLGLLVVAIVGLVPPRIGRRGGYLVILPRGDTTTCFLYYTMFCAKINALSQAPKGV